MKLPYELLQDIITFLDGEIESLYACTLTCHALCDVATPLLYKRIHLSPPKMGLVWQVLEVSAVYQTFIFCDLLPLFFCSDSRTRQVENRSQPRAWLLTPHSSKNSH